MDDDLELQDRRRAYVAQVITGLNAIEARRTHYERFDEAKSERAKAGIR